MAALTYLELINKLKWAEDNTTDKKLELYAYALYFKKDKGLKFNKGGMRLQTPTKIIIQIKTLNPNTLKIIETNPSAAYHYINMLDSDYVIYLVNKNGKQGKSINLFKNGETPLKLFLDQSDMYDEYQKDLGEVIGLYDEIVSDINIQKRSLYDAGQKILEMD